MSDFINNLLQRSGIASSNGEAPVILQPRLPSLFEPAQTANGIPVPPPDQESPEAIEAATSPVTPEPRSATLPAHPTLRPPDVEAATEPSPASSPSQDGRLVPPVRKTDRVAGSDVRVEKEETATSQGGVREQQGQVPDSVPDTRKKPAMPARHTTNLRPDVPAPFERETPAGISQPAPPVFSPALQGRGETPQGRSSLSNEEQAIVSPHRPQRGEQAVADDSGTRRNVRSRAETIRPSLQQAQVSNAPIFVRAPHPANSQPEDQEPVVHIRIGRIDVRAATPPAPQSVAKTPPAKPKMDLDDYLRRRENQR